MNDKNAIPEYPAWISKKENDTYDYKYYKRKHKQKDKEVKHKLVSDAYNNNTKIAYEFLWLLVALMPELSSKFENENMKYRMKNRL